MLLLNHEFFRRRAPRRFCWPKVPPFFFLTILLPDQLPQSVSNLIPLKLDDTVKTTPSRYPLFCQR